MKNIESKQVDFVKNFPDHFFTYEIENQKMRVAWSGDEHKRPLIFVHGSPGSYDAWAEFLLDKNLQNKFHLLAVDRPGYGGSHAGRAELSLKKQSDDILAALQFNKSGLPAILVGHSYGGPVVARMAMDRPDLVAGLVFVAGSMDPELEETKWYQYVARWSFLQWVIPDSLLVCNEEIMALKPELEEMQPFWNKIRAPSFILQGDSDELVPPANVNFMKSQMTRGQIINVELIPEMNHFIPWKRPELILKAIESLQSKLAANSQK